jgi:uncharacterized RDD family membrane protein YckC
LSSAIDTIVTAETPEGIAIAIRPAGFAVRCCAFLLDAMIRIVIIVALAQAFDGVGGFGFGLEAIALFLVNWLYPVIFELLPAAATPGKRAMGIQVMMANGLPITPAGCLTRNLLRAVDMLPAFYGFAVIMMLLRPDSRRLGDLAGGTLVVYRAEPPAAGGFGAAAPTAPPVPLSPRQRAAIAAFAWRAGRLTPERAEEIAEWAAPVLGAASNAPLSGTESQTTRLIGIARWLHGERRTVAGTPGANRS